MGWKLLLCIRKGIRYWLLTRGMWVRLPSEEQFFIKSKVYNIWLGKLKEYVLARGRGGERTILILSKNYQHFETVYNTNIGMELLSYKVKRHNLLIEKILNKSIIPEEREKALQEFFWLDAEIGMESKKIKNMPYNFCARWLSNQSDIIKFQILSPFQTSIHSKEECIYVFLLKFLSCPIN